MPVKISAATAAATKKAAADNWPVARKAKPVKSRIIQLFLRSGVPFLNADDGDVVTAGVRVLDDIHDEASSPGRPPAFAWWHQDRAAQREWAKHPKACTVFAQARDLSRWLLLAALGQATIPGCRDEVATAIARLRVTMLGVQSGMSAYAPVVQLALPGLSTALANKYQPGEYTRVMIEERGAVALIVGFTARTVEAESAEGLGTYCPATAYIGACPRCKVIFEKKRKDQEYCGERCRSAAATSRYDKRK